MTDFKGRRGADKDDDPPNARAAWDRASAAHARLNLLDRAFPKNEYGEPDYEGHRRYHASLLEAAKIMQGYKQTATTEIVKWVGVSMMGGLLGLLASWLKDHIK